MSHLCTHAESLLLVVEKPGCKLIQLLENVAMGLI